MKHLSFSFLSLFLATLMGWGGFFGESAAQYIGEDYCDYGDLMQQAFCVANRKETIIDLGTTKNAVGNEMIKGSININLDFDSDTDTLEKRPSILIRITQFILMLTIVLAVTMTIINGILYITKSGNGEDPSKVRWNLLYVAIGILLALFSVIIVNLLRSALNEETLNVPSSEETVNLTKTVMYSPSEGPAPDGVTVLINVDRSLYIPDGWEGVDGQEIGKEFKKTYTDNVDESISVSDTDENLWRIPVKIDRIKKCSDGKYYDRPLNGMNCEVREYEGLQCYTCTAS